MSAADVQVAAEDLLASGAVLPLDAEGAGEQAVPVTARAYRHPGLADRVVVRLTPEPLGAAEDMAAGFLGLTPDGEPAPVGLGRSTSVGFPEWVLMHHPEDGHHALAVVPELERLARQAKSKPGAALDGFQELAQELAAAVPHFLPTFFEQVGRAFLSVENTTYAAQMFAKARKAEAEHGLVIDEDRLDAVFLEFALAGALPVKVLDQYAKELAVRVSADEAFRRFRTLCLRRTAGGLPPSAQTSTAVRRMARAAGHNAAEAERAFLGELLELPATLRASEGWWAAHRAGLVALAARNGAIRGKLLHMMPVEYGCPLWLDLLNECGATAGLCGSDLPADQRPADGTAGWLHRFLEHRGSPQYQSPMPALYALLERCADQLRTELVSSGAAMEFSSDPDLLNLLLALDIPVDEPGYHARLWLDNWASGDQTRDLRALSADARFLPAFHRGVNALDHTARSRQVLQRLADDPGGSSMLATWVNKAARAVHADGLPRLPQALEGVSWLPAEALALAAEEIRAVAATDVAGMLVQTLRGGLFEELTWPAWDEAIAALGVDQRRNLDIFVADAWPYLVVANATQARVIDANGTVLTHDLRIPSETYGAWENGFHYVDGELLVYWHSWKPGERLRGYWHTDAGTIFPITSGDHTHVHHARWLSGSEVSNLPVPSGGRTTGAGLLHRGDTAVPEDRQVISDGQSFWAWLWNSSADVSDWYEFDPVTGQRGRRCMPGFFEDALRAAPQGSHFVDGWLLPTPDGTPTEGDNPGGGLLGWAVVKLPDGSLRGTDLVGNGVTVPRQQERGYLSGAVRFPGHDQPRAVMTEFDEISLVNSDGVVTATLTSPGENSRRGARYVPPPPYWHHLRPRDPQGSRALRRVDRETAVALLKAAGNTPGKGLDDLIRGLLPEVSEEVLVAGIGKVARLAAEQSRVLESVVGRLTEDLGKPTKVEEKPLGPSDAALRDAMSGLSGNRGYIWYSDERDAGVARLVQTIDQAVHQGVRMPSQPTTKRLHTEGKAQPNPLMDLAVLADGGAALAYRAASPLTDTNQATAIDEFLPLLESVGLDTADQNGPWRKFVLQLPERVLPDTHQYLSRARWCGLLPMGETSFIAFVHLLSTDTDYTFTALYHDPTGQFAIPEPYTIRSSSLVGEQREAGWLKAFLTERASRGRAPWFPEAAEEFARLTGVGRTVAKLLLAGLPRLDSYQRNFLPKDVRETLGLKVGDAAIAREELRQLDPEVRQALVSALLPVEPARLWTDGPDVAAAARLWNDKVGQRVPVPEQLAGEAIRALPTPAWQGWPVSQALPAFLDPAAEPQLSRDLRWHVQERTVAPAPGSGAGFTADTLITSVALAAWLAHRLPAGDQIRANLPAVLGAVGDRLANPDLLLSFHRGIHLPSFRTAAGAPTEVGEGFERYGAVLMPTHGDQSTPAVVVALLDAAGGDPYLSALTGMWGNQVPVEVALRTALAPGFTALLADPGDPVAGERDQDGTWWPQDPARSVPDLVADVARAHGISEDAAAHYLMLLAMPDPTDRNTARWTGWKPGRLRAARTELAGTDLVVQAKRARAGRSLFLPGGWADAGAARIPIEPWKQPLHELLGGSTMPVPTQPVPDVYRMAWQRVKDGEGPAFAELTVRRGRRR